MNAHVEPGALLTKAARGGVWIMALRVSVQGVMMLKLLILARLLSLADFGLMGIALLTILFLEALSVTGIDIALVQKKGNIEEYLDTAWVIAVVRGLFLGALLFLAAPLVAMLFENPAVTDVVRAIALAPALRGMMNIAVVYFQKEMEFNKTFLMSLAEAASDTIVSLAGAVILQSVWGLILGYLAGIAARVLTSYFLHPWRPHFRFELVKAKALSHFGKWFWASNLMTFLGSDLDSVVVGRLLGTTALGLYQMGNRIATYLTREISDMVSQVTFPVYSKLQEEQKNLHKSFLLTARMIFSVMFPMALVLALFPQQIVAALLGDKWMPIVPAVGILAVSGLARGMASQGGWLFCALGTPRLNFVVTAVRLLVLVILLVPLSLQYGLVGTGISVLAANTMALIAMLVLMPKAAGIKIHTYLSALGLPFGLGLVVFGLLSTIWKLVDLNSSGQSFILASIFAIAVLGYGLCLAYSERQMLKRLKNIFLQG